MYDNELDGQVFKATEDIKRGDPLTLSYGKNCNTKLLLTYGFVLEDNEWNDVTILVHLRKNDPCLEFKTKLVKDKKDYRNFDVFADLKHESVQDFISFVRLAIADDVKSLNFDDKEKTMFSGVELENDVWNEIKSICFRLLSGFETTY